MEKIRLQKFFTDCGVLSRRKAEEEIKAGKVKVNGVVAQLGDKIDPNRDTVLYNGSKLKPTSTEHHYILLNKPRGYVTTLSDDKGRKNVSELVSNVGVRVYPVGRLDMQSEGMLLFTDDGEFANHLTHPSHEVPKIYEVKVKEPLTTEVLTKLSSPMEIDGYQLQPVTVHKYEDHFMEMILYEGRNRQIRKMCEQVGLHVSRLMRVAIGNIKIGDLPIGKWRNLTKKEVAYLIGKEQEHAESDSD